MQTEYAFKAADRRELEVSLEDIYAVPDYKNYFEGFTQVKRAFKTHNGNRLVHLGRHIIVFYAYLTANYISMCV